MMGACIDDSKSYSSDLLFEAASLACIEIMSCTTSMKPPSILGGKIGTTLYLIAAKLELVQAFQLPVKAQDLSCRALQDCLRICKWPINNERSVNRLSYFSSAAIYKELQVLSAQSKLRIGIKKFLSAELTQTKFYADRFEELLVLIDPENRKLGRADEASPYRKHSKPQNGYVYPDNIRENLIAVLNSHAMCLRSVHKPMSTSPRHPTRLCLSTEGRNVNQVVTFDLVMASMDFEFWRDFSLSVSLKNDERSETPSDSTPTAGQEEDPDCQVDIVKPGDVCQLLERVRNSRTSPKVFFKLDQNFCLHREKRAEMMPYRKPHGEGKSLADLLNSDQYSLTPKVKIMLSFAVARSFWEFYGSESTTTQWCSDNIWFMPREKANRKHTDALELKAFVGFPSGENFPGPNEFLDVDEVTHTYPRILCLGIILLEIGLGKNLGLLPFTASNNLEDVRNGVNDAHSDAGCQREELKNEIWDTCRNKFAFDDAISNCMNPNKFIESSKTREKRSRLSPDRYKNLSPHLKAIEDGKRAKYHALAMQDRREAIYKHVVSPLYWLATVGYDNGNNDVFIEPSKQQHGKDHRPTFAPEEADRAELKRLSKQLQNPTFNSGAHVKEDAERWFEDIRAISSLVFRRRRMGTKLPPLRIAILDTGCDTSLNCFRAAQCFKGWRDFAVEPPSQTEVDEYGHGTFMVRLVMQIVPGCELYIARIAKTTHQLEGNGKLIAEAINHAGNDWEVDVISMSFGFPKFSQLISDAIANVRKIRKGAIVFLASAGNDVNRAEAYPACDPSVISIYATESNGAFLNTNPLSSRESLRVLGTYGDNVPEAVLAELRVRFPKGDFNAGTSIATAVAAGIAGLVLAYAAILPHVLRGIGVESLYSELKTTDGMRHMLFAMAKSWNDRQYFVNAISFWSYNLENSDMFRAICRALPQNEVMR